MQPESYPDQSHPRLHVHPSREADQLKRALLDAGRAGDASALLRQIGATLVSSVLRDRSGGPLTPVVVMRGGLLIWDTCRDTWQDVPWGILAPFRRHASATPVVAYGSVPRQRRGSYVLLDMLIASGQTMVACGEALTDGASRAGDDLIVAAPFAARVGWQRILGRFPRATLHCIWHDEKVDRRGRMVGPGFDIGDCALRATDGSRLWAAHGSS